MLTPEPYVTCSSIQNTWQHKSMQSLQLVLTRACCSAMFHAIHPASVFLSTIYKMKMQMRISLFCIQLFRIRMLQHIKILWLCHTYCSRSAYFRAIMCNLSPASAATFLSISIFDFLFQNQPFQEEAKHST